MTCHIRLSHRLMLLSWHRSGVVQCARQTVFAIHFFRFLLASVQLRAGGRQHLPLPRCPGKHLNDSDKNNYFAWFLRAKAECFARLCRRLGVCPSVCLSHSWIVSKRCKLGSRNLYFGLPQVL